MIDSPIVMFSNEEMDNIVLSKLGFNEKDIIDVYKFYEYNEYTDFLFKVNDKDDEYRIRLSKWDNVPVINFIRDDKNDEYFCNIDDYNKFDVKLKPRRLDNIDEVKNNDDSKLEEVVDTDDEVMVYDELSSSRGYLNYRVINKNYIIEINFSKYELYYGILNKNKVYEYLANLEFPVSIIDIYKNICEIARIEDISKFSLFDLRILSKNKDNDFDITDMLTISDGQLVAIMITRGDKQVYSNQIGVWSCEGDRSIVEFVTVKNDNSMSFNTKVKFKNENVVNMEEVAQEDVMSAKIEVAKVKKLAKETSHTCENVKFVILGKSGKNTRKH